MCVVHVVLACFRKSRASFFSAPALAGTEKVKAIGGSRALGHDLSIVPKPTIELEPEVSSTWVFIELEHKPTVQAIVSRSGASRDYGT